MPTYRNDNAQAQWFNGVCFNPQEEKAVDFFVNTTTGMVKVSDAPPAKRWIFVDEDISDTTTDLTARTELAGIGQVTLTLLGSGTVTINNNHSLDLSISPYQVSGDISQFGTLEVSGSANLTIERVI
jgi:hypothetical protein